MTKLILTNLYVFKIKTFYSGIFCFAKVFGQIEHGTDTSLKVSLNWEVGDTHLIKILSNTIDTYNNESKNSFTNYIAKFNIVDKTKDGFIINWRYTKCTLDPNETNIENIILGNLINVIFNLSVSLNGEIKEIRNVDNVRFNANKVIDSLIIFYNSTSQKKIQFHLAKQIISTNNGIETALLKHFAFYNLFFGSTYVLKMTKTTKTTLQNVFADQACDAIEKITLLQIDNKNNICVLEKKITTDGLLLKQNLLEYLEKSSTPIPKEVLARLKKNNFEYSETFLQKINYKQSIVLSSRFTRKMNLGYSNRTIIINIDEVN